MATTSVDYKGQLVFVPESVLECVGYMLFYEASLNTNSPAEKLRFEQMVLEFKSRMYGVGCTDLGLDQILQGDREKEIEFLSFVKLVRTRLASFGELIPVDYVNKVFVVHDPSWKDGTFYKPWFHKILNIIEYLIQGRTLDPNMLFQSVIKKYHN
jgi:hypothetical protein